MFSLVTKKKQEMLGKLKSYSQLIINTISPLERYLREVDLKRKFSVELDLIKGQHQNYNKHPSIIHFSLNKAATQYTGRILEQCAVENGMVPVSIHGYAFHTNFPYLDHLTAEEMQKYQHIFRPNGYLYSVFGGMVEGIPELEKYKIVLMVRDFRDLLVSEYFSIAYSHIAPYTQGNKYELFVEQRRKARESTIDEYAVTESNRIYNTLLRYKTLLVDKYPNVYITKYEDMINDFRGWLNSLLYNCELNIRPNFFKALLERNESIRPKDEDFYKHIRKGKSGEYKEKLNQETIEYINAKFSPMLLTFGYRLDSVY
jgi:hypothetical protein